MNPCQGPGCLKPAKRIYCSQRCCHRANVARSHVLRAEPKPELAPVTGSWWLGLPPAEFYTKARALFPLNGPNKDSTPVATYGQYEHGILAMGRARLRERRNREELR